MTEIDLHLFDLRYQETRIKRPRLILRLLESISSEGLLSPITAIQEDHRFVLIDGYARFEVVRNLGKDTILTTISDAVEQQALLQYLRLNQSERHEPIEEGWLIDI